MLTEQQIIQINEIKEDLKNIFFKNNTDVYYHSLRVYHKTLLYHENSFELLIIALLHDVLEDTKFSLQDLKNMYYNKFQFLCNNSEIIFNSLVAITRQKSEIYIDYITRCKNDDYSRIIKFLDIEENLMRCFESQNKSLAERYLNALNVLF